jgi:replication factor C subunit 1
MGVRVGKKACLIMDEVDGMSAGDRGGVGALNILIKKTRVSSCDHTPMTLS